MAIELTKAQEQIIDGLRNWTNTGYRTLSFHRLRGWCYLLRDDLTGEIVNSRAARGLMERKLVVFRNADDKWFHYILR